jgi:hypothetical protein
MDYASFLKHYNRVHSPLGDTLFRLPARDESDAVTAMTMRWLKASSIFSKRERVRRKVHRSR